MKNRLYTSLFAVAISLSCAFGFAYAPVMRDLPSINIGDLENSIGTDNNFFVYTDAFKLDDYVADPDTTISSLIWSFDEATGPGDAPGAGSQWFQINGKDPVLLGDTAIAADAPLYPLHLNPTANNLRATSDMASFRDIVFSPPANLPPFPTPVDPAKSNHALGKTVRFYVSDGTPGHVVYKPTIVKSTLGTSDSKSGGAAFVLVQDDTFTTGDPDSGTLAGWQFSGNGLSTKDYNLGNHSIGVAVGASPTNKFRSGGWQANFNEWLPYAMSGPTNVVRAKYYMYATGQSQNQISTMRLRVQQRFAVDAALLVNGTWPGATVATEACSKELVPSADPTKPSLYRVDFQPIDTPILSNGLEGAQRYWDLYANLPQFTGTVSLSESAIGYYPRSLIAKSAGVLGKTYNPSDLWTYFATDNQTLVYDLNVPTGDFPTSATAQPLPTIVENGAGVTLDCSATYPAGFCALPSRDFNPPQDYNNFPSLVRVEEGKQYVARWHLTSTQATNRQSAIRMRSRSVGFAWANQLELAGAYPSGTSGPANVNDIIAQQAAPGVGCLNPDKEVPGENGGWYTMIMNTPLSQDIRPDVAGSTIAAKMPFISAQPGPGVNLYGVADRAWRFGLDVMSTIDQGTNRSLEKGNVLMNKLELRTYTLVNDN